MKVLVLSHSSELDGAEKSMLGLFDYWRKITDIEPEFIIRKPVRGLAQELKKRGLNYHTLYYTNWAQRNPSHDPADTYWYAKQNTRAVAEIEKLIKKTRPDIVMTNTIVAPWAAFAAHNQGVPHVWFIREFGAQGQNFEFKIGQLETFKAIGVLSDLVVANSEALARFAEKYIEKKKLTILYPYLDLNELKQQASERVDSPFKDNSSLKLVVTGRISPAKGQAVAAAAAGIVNQMGVACELCIIGSPANKNDDEQLRAVIEEYGLGKKVHMLGQQHNPLAYVAQADVGIMSSRHEAFGRVTLEYMALGKPVVGADSGATPELVKPNVNGFLYDSDKPEDLVDKLLIYAKDKRLIAKHGLASKKMAQAITRSSYVPEKLYKKLTKLAALEKNHTQKREGSVNSKWTSYPVLLDARAKKPKLSKRLTKSSVKRLIKSAYIKLN